MSFDLKILEIASAAVDAECGHHLRIRAANWVASLSIFVLFLYGWDYCLASEKRRAQSPKAGGWRILPILFRSAVGLLRLILVL